MKITILNLSNSTIINNTFINDEISRITYLPKEDFFELKIYSNLGSFFGLKTWLNTSYETVKKVNNS